MLADHVFIARAKIEDQKIAAAFPKRVPIGVQKKGPTETPAIAADAWLKSTYFISNVSSKIASLYTHRVGNLNRRLMVSGSLEEEPRAVGESR